MTYKKKILIAIIIFLLLRLLIIHIGYDTLQERNKYDFSSYQKVSKTLIGQNTEITKRDWQYPPLYSILIIPALFVNTIDYLLLLDTIFSIIAFYFLFLFISMFLSETKAILISFIILSFDFAYLNVRMGLPITLSSMLFTIFIYYLYNIKTTKIKTNNAFIYCSISFSLLILTKYLFFALVPFIAYWLYINYKEHINKRLILFFWLPILFLSIWFLKNCLSYGFTPVGILGGYSHVSLNVYLIPNKLLFLFTNSEARRILSFYLLFIISYLALLFLYYSKYIHLIDKYYIRFNSLLLFYFISTFFMFGFLYYADGFRIRYFIYQTAIITALFFINILLIDEKLTLKRKMRKEKKI